MFACTTYVCAHACTYERTLRRLKRVYMFYMSMYACMRIHTYTNITDRRAHENCVRSTYASMPLHAPFRAYMNISACLHVHRHMLHAFLMRVHIYRVKRTHAHILCCIEPVCARCLFMRALYKCTCICVHTRMCMHLLSGPQPVD